MSNRSSRRAITQGVLQAARILGFIVLTLGLWWGLDWLFHLLGTYWPGDQPDLQPYSSLVFLLFALWIAKRAFWPSKSDHWLAEDEREAWVREIAAQEVDKRLAK